MLKSMQEIYAAGGTEHNDLMIDQGIYEIGTTFDPNDAQAQKWINNQADIQFVNTNETIDRNIKQALNDILTKGISVSTQADAKRLLRTMQSSIAETFDKYNTNNLRTMIRTETARMVVESRLDSYEQEQITIVEILVSPTADEECQVLVGNQYWLQGPNPDDLPPAHGVVPVHPNCTCDLIPVIPGT